MFDPYPLTIVNFRLFSIANCKASFRVVESTIVNIVNRQSPISAAC